MSLKYYDPILKIIQENCSDSKKDYFIQDNKYALLHLQEADTKKKFLKMIGVIDNNPIKSKPLTFKHTVINKKEEHQIPPSKSKHAKSLQRSNYVTIEKDIQ